MALVLLAATFLISAGCRNTPQEKKSTAQTGSVSVSLKDAAKRTCRAEDLPVTRISPKDFPEKRAHWVSRVDGIASEFVASGSRLYIISHIVSSVPLPAPLGRNWWQPRPAWADGPRETYDSGFVTALEKDGRILWRREFPSRISNKAYSIDPFLVSPRVIGRYLVLLEGGEYVALPSYFRLVALDKVTGEVFWRTPFIFQNRDQFLLGVGRSAVVVSVSKEVTNRPPKGSIDFNGLLGIDIDKQRISWRSPALLLRVPPVIQDHTVYFLARSRTLTALDGTTGRLAWRKRLGGLGSALWEGMRAGNERVYLALLFMEGPDSENRSFPKGLYILPFDGKTGNPEPSFLFRKTSVESLAPDHWQVIPSRTSGENHLFMNPESKERETVVCGRGGKEIRRYTFGMAGEQSSGGLVPARTASTWLPYVTIDGKAAMYGNLPHPVANQEKSTPFAALIGESAVSGFRFARPEIKSLTIGLLRPSDLGKRSHIGATEEEILVETQDPQSARSQTLIAVFSFD